MRSGPTSGSRLSMRFRFVSVLVCAALTACNYQLPSPVESFSPIQKHVRFQIHSSPARSGPYSPVRSQLKHLLAAPETKSRIEANYNATDVSSASIAKVERAWTLDSDTASNPNGDLSIGTSSTSTQSLLLNVDVLGPLFCISFVMVFLCSTLLNSGGISDTFLDMNLSQKLNVLSKISWFPGQVQEAQLVVGLVMAFSAFAQALTGFGFAVVAVGAMSSMPWLLHSELFNVITPVAATLGALVGFILLIPYAFGSPSEGNEDEPGLEWDQILPLLIPCTVLTPLGIQLNNMVDPILATRVLAALIMGFVAYKLVPTIQDALASDDSNTLEPNDDDDDASSPSFLQSQTAAILFGSAAGVFGGAFDVQGPPLCVYGDAKGWSPAQFRNNVLAVVCLNSALVVAIDAAQGTLGDFYYSYFCLTSLPGVLLGIVAGQYASERIDPVLFKNVVLVMCLGLGVQLLTAS